MSNRIRGKQAAGAVNEIVTISARQAKIRCKSLPGRPELFYNWLGDSEYGKEIRANRNTNPETRSGIVCYIFFI